MGRGSVAQRLGRFRAGRRRIGPRQPRRYRGRHLRDLRRDLGRERRDGGHHRQGHGAGDAARRLSGDLHRRAHHRGRRDRRDHPAQHSDDRLRRRRGGIGGAALRRRRDPGSDDRRHARGLCRLAGEARELRRRRAVRASTCSCTHSAAACGRWARRSSSSAASMAACSRRPKPPPSPASTPALRHHLRVPRARLARHRRGRRRDRAVHRPDPHHRRLRRACSRGS